MSDNTLQVEWLCNITHEPVWLSRTVSGWEINRPVFNYSVIRPTLKKKLMTQATEQKILLSLNNNLDRSLAATRIQ